MLCGRLWFAFGCSREDNKAVTVRTMQFRPNGGVDFFIFCREQNVVSFGQGLNGPPEAITEYRSIRTQEGAYPGDTLLNTTLDYFENMTATNYVNLVWVCDPDGYYYICEITGPYQYSRGNTHETAGIVNFTACTFCRVGFEDLAPESVTEELNLSGVIRYVRDVEAIEETTQLWKILRN